MAFRELATLIGAGISIMQALSDQLRRPMSHPFRRFFQTASKRVSGGERLSVVMRDHGGMFSAISIALIEAGEVSGRLDLMLSDVASYLERELELRRMIARETFYAKILVAAALLIPLAARCIVAWLMQGLLAAIVVLLKTLLGYLIIGGVPLLALYIVYAHIASTRTGKNNIDAMKLRVPVIGGIVQKVALAKFARAYAALYDAGVSPAKAVPLAAQACGNRHLASGFEAAAARVEQGIPLSEALVGTPISDSLLVRLLATGEQTGNVDAMMLKAAEHYEDEAHTQIRRLAVAIVPVVVIITGIVVCLMVLRFYVGLYGSLF